MIADAITVVCTVLVTFALTRWQIERRWLRRFVAYHQGLVKINKEDSDQMMSAIQENLDDSVESMRIMADRFRQDKQRTSKLKRACKQIETLLKDERRQSR